MKGKIKIEGLQEAIDAFIDSQVLIPASGNQYLLKTQIKHPQVAVAAKNPAEPRNIQRVDLGAMINWADVRAKFPVTSRSVYLNTAAAGPLATSTAKAGSFYYEQMMNDGDVHWDDWLAEIEKVGRA